MSRSLIRLTVLLTAIFFALGICQFDLKATPLGQNSNSSVTTDSNTGMEKSTRHRSGRRRAAKTNTGNTDQSMSQTDQTSGTANQTGDQSNMSNMKTTGGMSTRHRRHRGRRAMSEGETSMSAGEQTDLSGTYAGTFDCSDAGMTGETTLTITGNQFTTADGKSGRIVANTTRGYTGVAVQFGEMAASTPGQPAPTAPTIVSMRAKKNGDRLMLTSVPGAMHQCSFMPSGAMARGRRHRSRHSTKVTNATGAEGTTSSDTVTTTPEAAATPGRRRGRRGRTNANSNMKMDQNMSGNDNTGTGNANMSAKPSPPPQK